MTGCGGCVIVAVIAAALGPGFRMPRAASPLPTLVLLASALLAPFAAAALEPAVAKPAATAPAGGGV